MSDEITISTRLSVSNGNFQFNRRVRNFRLDQDEAGGGGPGTIQVGSTEVAVDVSQYGIAWLQNLEPNNDVRFGFQSGSYPLRLRSEGQPTMLEFEEGQTIYLIAESEVENDHASVYIAGMFR